MGWVEILIPQLESENKMPKNNQVADELTLKVKEVQDAGKVNCCGIVEALHQMYPLPFDRPVVITESLNMKALGFAIRMLNRTPSGNVSQKMGPIMFISHCPFCGKPFEDEESKAK